MADNLLIRNIGFDEARILITASHSSGPDKIWTEGYGRRYYLDQIGTTFSNNLDATEYSNYLTFTTVNTAPKEFFVTQMNTAETMRLELIVLAIKDDGTAGYSNDYMQFYRRGSSGNVVKVGTHTDDEKHDGTMNCDITTRVVSNGVWVKFTGVTSHTIDWNVHLKYYKGYHRLIDPNAIPSPVDPRPPET